MWYLDRKMLQKYSSALWARVLSDSGTPNSRTFPGVFQDLAFKIHRPFIIINYCSSWTFLSKVSFILNYLIMYLWLLGLHVFLFTKKLLHFWGVGGEGVCFQVIIFAKGEHYDNVPQEAPPHTYIVWLVYAIVASCGGLVWSFCIIAHCIVLFLWFVSL